MQYKLIVLLFLFFNSSTYGDEKIKTNNYKPLNEQIESNSYQLTRLVNGNYDIHWDPINKGFALSSYATNYRVNKHGELTKFTRWRNVRTALKRDQIESMGITLIDLMTYIKENELNEEQAYDYLNNLYDNSSTFAINESGWIYEFYFHSQAAWYYLEYDARHTNSDLVKRLNQFYDAKNQRQKDEYLIELQANKGTQYDFDYNWKKKSNLIRLDDFIKERSESDITAYLPQIPTYYVGQGLYTIAHQGEQLRIRFKTLKKIFGFSKYWGYLRVFQSPKDEYADWALLEASDPNDHDKLNGLYLIHPKE